MRRPAVLVPALLLAACNGGTTGGSGPEAQRDADVVYGTRVHKMPVREPGPRPLSAPSGSHLNYYGGRVVSNVKVVQVLYGSGTYLSNITSTATPSLSTFYQQMLNSPYVDWLTEYDTNITAQNGQPGTNQIIGRGNFLAQTQIAPASSRNGTTITDSQIQTEINAQIAAGTLPPPDTNTAYMINFPRGKRITQGGSSSCVSGGFCAYHGTFTRGSQDVYYGVLPDMSPGSGCDLGCGSSTWFNNQTSVASHELVETITDPEVGLATTLAPPLAWYDQSNGEIGDICNGQQGTIVGTDGVTYTVQKEFSNLANDCIVSRPVSNDFSIAVNPASLTIQQGSSGSATVSTAVTSGSAQTISLSASGQPGGATVSFSPASVSAGQGSTMTVSVGPATASGNYTITVTGTAQSGSHSTALALTVTNTPPPPPGALVNGDFETGSLSPWIASGAAESVVSSGCRNGSFCAQLGSSTPTNGDSSISQSFTAPAGATGLSLWYKMSCPDAVTYDWATVTLADTTSGTTATLLPRTCATGSWTQVTGVLTAGHGYRITLVSHDDNYPGDPTITLFDDVSITTGAPPPPPPGAIVNGNFEAGSLAGWTTAGASETVVGSGCHGGTYCARLGSSAATTGDSSIAQRFTVPSGASQLGIWYASSCPDTVTYDWVTITLQDTTAVTTTTVLPRTCASSFTWTNVTSAVVVGHSYTLTITSHDDGYPTDPTFTLADDVTLN
jgi:hypothetical protein